MKSWFKNTLRVTTFLFMLLFVSVFLMAATAESSSIYNIGLGFLTATLCASPMVGMSLLISGIGTLVENYQDSEATEKQKRKRRPPLEDMDDDYRIRRIMAQLTPQDRDYLRERLAAQRLGLSDDGELVSLDEVLAEMEEDDNRRTESD